MYIWRWQHLCAQVATKGVKQLNVADGFHGSIPVPESVAIKFSCDLFAVFAITFVFFLFAFVCVYASTHFLPNICDG